MELPPAAAIPPSSDAGPGTGSESNNLPPIQAHSSSPGSALRAGLIRPSAFWWAVRVVGPILRVAPAAAGEEAKEGGDVEAFTLG